MASRAAALICAFALLAAAMAHSAGSGTPPEAHPEGPPAGGEGGPADPSDFGGVYDRQGKPSSGPCPQGCRCFVGEEGCQLFTDCHGAGLTEVPSKDIDPKTDCMDISQNQLPASAGMFDALPAGLQYLELHGNKLGEGSALSSQLGRFTSLVHLGLEQNGFTELSASLLAGLKNLKVVYLSHNDIATVADKAFADNAELRVLLLQHNKIASLPDGVFNGLSKLKVLKLADNKFTTPLAADSPLFKGLNVFQLDLTEDSGDHYEDAMLEGLTNIAELGNKVIDEEKVRKDAETGRLDDDLFYHDEAHEVSDDQDEALDDETLDQGGVESEEEPADDAEEAHETEGDDGAGKDL